MSYSPYPAVSDGIGVRVMELDGQRLGRSLGGQRRRPVLVTVAAREGDGRGVGQGDRLGLAAEGELLRHALALDVDQHGEMREWVGDRLRPFGQQVTNRRVRDAVGRVPESVRLLIGLLADGVKLTPGGRLPRVIVRAVQQQRPDWYPLGRPASIEEGLLPLAALHDMLRHVGLLRLANGVLCPTKAAGDEIETVRRLRTWFPSRECRTLLAERAVALVAARGPQKVPDLAGEVLDLLGHGWRRGNDPITVTDVQRDLYRLAHQLAAVDMLATTWTEWSAGPSAHSLLPGVPLLADLG